MNRISQLRQELGITMKEAAERLGFPYTTYVNYEKGAREPNSETLIALANFYSTSIDYLLGRSNERNHAYTENAIPYGFSPMPEMVEVPLIGRVACGEPITAEQNIERMVGVPAEWRANFTLLCEGDSMEPCIKNGDLVAIRSQPEVENGEIAAVRIGDEATLKHVYVYSNYVELRPENPTYQSIIKIGEDMNDVHIEGKAVGLCRGM